MKKPAEGLEFYKRKKKINPGIFKELAGWLFRIFVTIFIAGVLVYFLGVRSNVNGDSMSPELPENTTVFLNRFVYIISMPKIGDIVCFLPNGNENTKANTKRVVARPGDTVKIENGLLYVNGEPSEYSKEYIYDPGIAVNSLTLESGTYFLLGDNPDSLEDSRSPNIGPVEITDIIGKVWLSLPNGEFKGGLIKR